MKGPGRRTGGDRPDTETTGRRTVLRACVLACAGVLLAGGFAPTATGQGAATAADAEAARERALGPIDAGRPPAPVRVSLDEAVRRLSSGGWAVLMRHATTEPGTGDPPGFRLGDCATQRNLSKAGRDEAAAAGQALRNRGLRFDEVRSSAWCRCVDTARAGFGEPRVWAPLNSFFEDRQAEAGQSDAVRAEIQRLQPPRKLLLVTHQVNITALTDVFPAQGEMVAVRWRDGALRAEFRFQPAGEGPRR